MGDFKPKKMNMRELARQMKRLDREAAKCSRCGICQSVCPLYAVTGDESDVARGKIRLLSGVMAAFFDDPRGVRQRLNRCLLCGSCAVACPRGVNTLELFLSARRIIAQYEGLSLINKLVFRRLLANPDVFDRVMERAARWQSLFLKKRDFPTAGSCGTLVSPLLSHRHLSPLAPVPFHKKLPEQAHSSDRSGMRVAFFVGCLLDKVFPNVASDIERVLNAHGFRVIIPRDQGCCGIPALAGGDQESFQRLLAYNIERFDPSTYDYLVTGCATCTAAIKKIWPAMVQGDSPDQSAAVQIAGKTYDVMQFLVEVAGVGPSSRQGKMQDGPVITYHDPCHLRKTLNISSQPRWVISAAGVGKFVEMPNASDCCGMGGSFNLAHYDLSSVIGEKKTNCIEASGASVVATGCPACMIQLADMLARKKKQVRVAHVMELYAEKISELTASEPR